MRGFSSATLAFFALLVICCAVFFPRPTTAVANHDGDHAGAEGAAEEDPAPTAAGSPEPEPSTTDDAKPEPEPTNGSDAAGEEGSAEKEPTADAEPGSDQASHAEVKEDDGNAASHVGICAPVVLSLAVFISMFNL